MRLRELARLIGSLGHPKHAQQQKVAVERAASEHQAASVGIVEGSVAVKPNCTHCGGKHVVRNGGSHGLQRYKCRSCRKTFNALAGIPLARVRMKGKWLGQMAVLRDGVTITQPAETDETYLLDSFKGLHKGLTRPSGKFPRSKFPSSSPVTAPAALPMPSCRRTTRLAS